MPIITSVDGVKKYINKIVHSVEGSKKEISKIYHSVDGNKTLVYQSRKYIKGWIVNECDYINNLNLFIGEKIDSFPKSVHFGERLGVLSVNLDMKVKANDEIVLENIKFATADNECQFSTELYVNDNFIGEWFCEGSKNEDIFKLKLRVEGTLKIKLSCKTANGNAYFSISKLRLNNYEL